ncbi:tetratricopeptide repeat protein [Chloroflexota bacterium]
MEEHKNPYIAGAPVVEKRMFFGREGVFEWIETSLTGKYIDHILVLHGQRRVGKTSVLKHIPNRLSDKYIPVFIDLQGRVSTSFDRFLYWLAREIIRALKDHGTDLPRPDRATFEQDPDHFESVFLPSIEEKLGEHSLLLTFDEFDTFESTDAQEGLAIPFMAILKRLMDRPNFSFVFSIGSSGRKLENMQAAYTSFFKQALYRKISFLEEYDTRDLIVKPVDGVLTYSNDAVRRIFEITSGHPYFVQLVCHELFSECQKNDHWQVNVNDVNNILESVVERGTVNLKFVWDEVSDLEKWILASLATDPDVMNLADLETHLKKEQVRFTHQEIERSLLYLREKDILTENNDFVIHLMRIWLNRNRPMEQVREELEDVNPIVNRLLEIGQEYHDKGEFEKAIQNFKDALDLEADNLEAHLLLGNSQLTRGDYGKAIVEFEAVLDVKIDDVLAQKGFCDAYLAMADEYYSDGKLDEAEYSFKQVLNVNPQHKQANLHMAEMHHNKAVLAIIGGEDGALDELEKALEYTDEAAFNELHKELKDFIAGKRKLSDMLLIWSEKAQEMGLWDEAGDLLDKYQRESGGDTSAAIAIKEINAKIKEKRKGALRKRAARLAGIGRIDEAVECWNSYLIVDPEQRVNVKKKIADLQSQAKATKAKKQAFNPILRAALIGFVVILIGVVVYLLAQPTSPLMIALAGPTSTPTSTMMPTKTPTPTLTATKTPTIVPTIQSTAIPLSWNRIDSGLFLKRDTVNEILFDPNDPDVMFAGTDNSGIYKTINGGISWTPSNIGLGNSRIDSLIIHPVDSNILYAGVVDDGAYKTEDGGQTWRKLSIFPNYSQLWANVSQIAMDPNNSDILYYCNGLDIYQSSNGGENWKTYSHFLHEPIAELSVSPDGILYYTVPWGDYSVHRINPDTLEIELIKINPNDAGDYDDFVSFDVENGLLFAGDRRQLFTSSDGGETWQNTGLNCIGVNMDGNGNALCIGSNYSSSDGGISWSQMNSIAGFNIKAGAISPFNSDVIVLGGENGIYKSIDRGISWDEISNGLGNSETQLRLDHTLNILYLESQNGDEANLFSANLSDYDFKQSEKLPDLDIFTDQNGRLYISIEGEPLWATSIITSGAMNVNLTKGEFIQFGKKVIYVSESYGSEGNVHRILHISRDNGKNWESLQYIINPYTDYSVERIYADSAKQENLYSISYNGGLFFSDNGGSVWTDCHTYLKYDALVFGLTERGNNILSFHPEKPGHFILTTRNQGLLESSSESCKDIRQIFPTTGLDNLFTRAVVRHPENPEVIYVGTANGFYISYNSGLSWGTVNDGLLGPFTIYSLDVDPNNPGIVYASTPYGVFQLIDR